MHTYKSHNRRSMPLSLLTATSTGTLPCPDDTLPPECEVPSTAEPSAAGRPGMGLGKALLWMVAFFGVTQVVPAFILAFSLAFIGYEPAVFKDYLLPMLLGGQILGVCLSVWVLRRRLGPTWRQAIDLRRPALVPCLLAVLALPLLTMLAGGASYLTEQWLGFTNPARELVAATPGQSLWLMVLVIAVGAAVNEELFCRGLLGSGLVGRYGVRLGVLFASVIFAALHGNIPQGCCALVLGVGVHLAYLATRSLWVPILLHFLNNALAVLAGYCISQAGVTPEVGGEMTAGAIVVWIVVLTPSLLATWGLYRLRVRQAAATQTV